MDIKQYDKDNLRNLLIDYIACARFIKENYEIDKKQRKIINNQVRLANMYLKKMSADYCKGDYQDILIDPLIKTQEEMAAISFDYAGSIVDERQHER